MDSDTEFHFGFPLCRASNAEVDQYGHLNAQFLKMPSTVCVINVHFLVMRVSTKQTIIFLSNLGLCLILTLN